MGALRSVETWRTAVQCWQESNYHIHRMRTCQPSRADVLDHLEAPRTKPSSLFEKQQALSV